MAQEDWLTVGSGERQFWFVSSLPNAAPDYPLVRDWVRSEIAADVKGSKSFLMYVEADCSKMRVRTLEYYHYRDNNLRGPFYTGEEPPEKWEEGRPGSIRHSFIQSICRSAR